jgi:hypothetical protein
MAVLNIYLKSNKDGGIISAERCELRRGVGIVGQPRSKDVSRQISFISADTAKQICEIEGNGVCLSRFYANFVLPKDIFKRLSPGILLGVGGAVIRISNHKKQCFDYCSLNKKGTPCPLPDGCAFGFVEVDGHVSVGDLVCIYCD